MVGVGGLSDASRAVRVIAVERAAGEGTIKKKKNNRTSTQQQRETKAFESTPSFVNTSW